MNYASTCIQHLIKAIMTTTCYHAIADFIHQLGQSFYFGLPSDDIIHLMHKVNETSCQMINLRHENSALMAAYGYAAANENNIGIAMIGRGPASCNSGHAMHFISKQPQSMIIFIGEHPAHPKTTLCHFPDYKSHPTKSFCESSGLPTLQIRHPHQTNEICHEAEMIARSNQTVIVLMPVDVLSMPCSPYQNNPHQHIPIAKQYHHTPNQQTQARHLALSTINKAQKPIFIVGHGANDISPSLITRLAKTCGGLITTSLKMKQTYSDSPYYLDVHGGFSKALTRNILKQSDCCLILGASMNQWTLDHGQLKPIGTVISIHHERLHDQSRYHPDIQIISDIEAMINWLLKHLKPKKQPKLHEVNLLKQIKAQHYTPYTVKHHKNGRINPLALLQTIDQTIHSPKLYFHDLGRFFMAISALNLSPPSCMVLTTDFYSVGLGLSLSIGGSQAKHADHRCVLVIGDGGFLMSSNELEVIHRYQCPVLIIVCNDAAYGAEIKHLKDHNMPETIATYPEVNIANIARGYGIEAHTITDLNQLSQIADKINDLRHPLLLDCKVSEPLITTSIPTSQS